MFCVLITEYSVGQLLEGWGCWQQAPLADFADLGDDDVDGYPGVVQAVTGWWLVSQYTGPRPLQPSPPGTHGHNDPGEQQPITGLATDPERQSEASTGYSLQVRREARRRWGRHRVLAGPGLTRGVIWTLSHVTWEPPRWSHRCRRHKQSWTTTTRFCQAPWPRISSHRKPRTMMNDDGSQSW